MCSPGINGGELKGQPANTGSPGKMAVKTECVSVSMCVHCFTLSWERDSKEVADGFFFCHWRLSCSSIAVKCVVSASVLHPYGNPATPVSTSGASRGIRRVLVISILVQLSTLFRPTVSKYMQRSPYIV